MEQGKQIENIDSETDVQRVFKKKCRSKKFVFKSDNTLGNYKFWLTTLDFVKYAIVSFYLIISVINFVQILYKKLT